MVVYNDTALLFKVHPTLDFFDLRMETWSSFETTYSPTAADIATGVEGGWSYPSWAVRKWRCNDMLYAFGGSHAKTRMDINLFMALDLHASGAGLRALCTSRSTATTRSQVRASDPRVEDDSAAL
ncbi:hypothetical protein B0H15DRAFT_956333 [Mycena belliarum]|uniref:Uncharacterized protein n=1 Tax=Mycena belliarum TaxID=1033014 RepID=A0AAD6TQP3_9AGAR|nr:hypothetical protein B0H15DRAFT_956333 [Mycena belliae]